MTGRLTCNGKLLLGYHRNSWGSPLLFCQDLTETDYKNGEQIFSISSKYWTFPTSTTSEIQRVVRVEASLTTGDATLHQTGAPAYPWLSSCAAELSRNRPSGHRLGGLPHTNGTPRVNFITQLNSICGSNSIVQHTDPRLRKKNFYVNWGWRTKFWTRTIALFTSLSSIATPLGDTVKLGCNSEGPLNYLKTFCQLEYLKTADVQNHHTF